MSSQKSLPSSCVRFQTYITEYWNQPCLSKHNNKDDGNKNMSRELYLSLTITSGLLFNFNQLANFIMQNKSVILPSS